MNAHESGVGGGGGRPADAVTLLRQWHESWERGDEGDHLDAPTRAFFAALASAPAGPADAISTALAQLTSPVHAKNQGSHEECFASLEARRTGKCDVEAHWQPFAESEWADHRVKRAADILRAALASPPPAPPAPAAHQALSEALTFLDKIIKAEEEDVIPDDWRLGNVRATYGDVKRLRAALRAATAGSAPEGASPPPAAAQGEADNPYHSVGAAFEPHAPRECFCEGCGAVIACPGSGLVRHVCTDCEDAEARERRAAKPPAASAAPTHDAAGGPTGAAGAP